MAILFRAYQKMEGAGVLLRRVFANDDSTDPFLLLDHFGSDNPADYIKGFPWHPHRGIETVTYMLDGIVEHGDSMGNKGAINSGDIQWMTAGSGIIHQEMPRTTKKMEGFQLWVNLPRKSKMIEPRYRGITRKDVPVVKSVDAYVRVISGTYGQKKGPVKDLVVDVEYLDVDQKKGFRYKPKKGYKTMCYAYKGAGTFNSQAIKEGAMILFDSVPEIEAKGKVRFILASGKPLHEPIAWAGPIVMNTDEELRTAFRELDEGNFIKHARLIPQPKKLIGTSIRLTEPTV